jgi:hypothetical protein
MSEGMKHVPSQDTHDDTQEPTVHELPAPDEVPGTAETWQDIAGQYRVDDRGPQSVLDAVDEVLLELAEALSDRAARETRAGDLALARRTQRYRRRVHELYTLAETVPQAQMAVSALALGAPDWLFEREDGRAWSREITALSDYASWALTIYGGADDADAWDAAGPGA